MAPGPEARRTADPVRRLSLWLARAAGALLLAAVALVVLEILVRKLADRTLGGAHEISGYVMALIAAWGFAYALVERAHVRIDVLRAHVPPAARRALDLIAQAALAFVALVIVWRGWTVVWTSFAKGSTANTPLQTPLVIPQALWFAGLVWFALVAVWLLVRGLGCAWRGDHDALERALGTGNEEEERLKEAESASRRDEGA